MQMRWILQRAGWLSVLALATACSLNVQPQIVATETPTATATDAATPTPTDTPAPPTATPLPTIVPQVALDAAGSDRVNGDYAEAAAQYQLVLDQGAAAPADALAEAALGFGQAALRQGLFDEAVDALTTYIAQAEDAESVGQARLLRGEASLGLSHWQEAIGDFEFYLTQFPGRIDSAVYARIGDAQLGRGVVDAALAAYAQAVDASRSLDAQMALRQRIAQLRLSRNEYTQALEQYDAILDSAQNEALRAQTELLAAQTLQAAGETERAMSRFMRVFETYPEQPQAYAALLVLLDAGYDINALQQARVAYAYGDYRMTAAVLTDYTTRYQLSAVPAELYMLLGQAYSQLGNPDGAVVAFQTVVTQYPRDPLFGDALLAQGEARFRAGDVPGAIEQYAQVVQNYGYLTQAAEALWQVGYLYALNGQPAEARAAFEQLSEAYPNTFQARSGLFLAGASAMAAGDLAGAERLYGLLAVSASGDEQAGAYLNAALLAQERGDTRFATDALSRAIAAAPDSYYAARAQAVMAGEAAFIPPVDLQFTFDEAEVAETEAWLREQFEGTATGALMPLPEALATDPRLVSGRDLWLLGAVDEARIEFADLLASYQSDGVASYQLAVYLRDLGDYNDAIVAAANVVRAAGAATLDVPALISRLRYPAYYVDLIRAAGEAYDVDPLLLYALIRHESLFDPWAVGANGALGLLQIDPGTAAYIAEQLDWVAYQPADLLRPNVNLTFGAFYLREQLDRFDGNVVAALAAFDAGPARAQAWYDLSGGNPDLLMTTITLDSTRTSIQRIYSYYNIYRALYGSAS